MAGLEKGSARAGGEARVCEMTEGVVYCDEPAEGMRASESFG